jgi:sugar lactone lactonase YvrE
VRHCGADSVSDREVATPTLTKVWAGAIGGRPESETPGDHPDGICIDVEGAVWYADVGGQHCVRVRERG